ncbi:MAG: DUF2637 domain-containing protein [Mycobacterium sp.]
MVRLAGSRRVLRRTRAAAVLITAGIGVASFVLSFAALRDLAQRSGIPEHLAWLWPLIVDGAILQATMAVIVLAGFQDQRRNRRFFWAVLTCSAAVSVGANALHAVIPADAVLSPWWAAGIAVVAPVSLLASTHGLSLLSRVGGQHDSQEAHLDDKATHDGDGGADLPPVRQLRPAASQVDGADRQRWLHLGEAVASREVVDDFEPDELAAVLHLSFERELSNRAIGRQFDVDHRVIGIVVAEGSELLASGEISVELVENKALYA